jgi:hypothetical protein
LYGPSGGRKVKNSPKCLLHCLKLVELVGFAGHPIDAEFVRYLVENAVELEKIIIDPRRPLMIGRPLDSNDIEIIHAARERAKMLKRELSIGDGLVIL